MLKKVTDENLGTAAKPCELITKSQEEKENQVFSMIFDGEINRTQ